MTIAIIPARGGSKRLPRKNIKPFCGLPLVAWSIIQAKNSKLIDEVYVSTDDKEIETISIIYGANIISRPEWVDSDEASAMRPIAHAIEILQKEYPDFNELIAILPTSPLNKPDDFDNAIKLFRENKSENIIPLRPIREVSLYHKFENNTAVSVYKYKNTKFLSDAGAWIVTTPQRYLHNYNKLKSDLDIDIDQSDNSGQPVNYYPMEFWQYADVDTEEEFKFAEVVFTHYLLDKTILPEALK